MVFSNSKIMKFEDFLMEPTGEHQRKLDLETEVVKLQAELHGEQELNKALHWALHGPLISHPHVSSSLPPQVQLLMEELGVVEREIDRLEKKVEELKLNLYKEREQNKEWEIQQRLTRLWQHNLLLNNGHEINNRSVLNGQRSRSQHFDELRKDIMLTERRFSSSAASDIQISMSSTGSRKNAGRSRKQSQLEKESCIQTPNELSEQLLKCLIGIYLDLNQPSLNSQSSPTLPKHGLSCINSKRCIAKTSFSCKAPQLTLSFDYSSSNPNPNPIPYSILLDSEGSVRDTGPYRNLIHITRMSFDIGRLPACSTSIRKLRILIHKLSSVDLTFLTYKQKLAFWINIYNSSIMHAFLEHGLPSTTEKLLALMNKAALNVGGIVLNALAIEHFILRHPSQTKYPVDEKEMLLRHAYGLGYPEPNVTFALCRGSWSSPALRVYTPEEVVNELGLAKVEYLEASVGMTSKKKIMVPKLLQWHMKDFADDMESLLEWIYSQLPRSASLKRSIMECLNGETKSPIHKMVEIQPYESEFRYLLSM
ncbi:uncharacterized protein LOC111006766 [Momordica charantia]|uniref:Uncharacterized protein LOC111006766 n=1 Tax=Momordica charantia TaxID=3673 RepID=A0A6J1C2A6_MOMCH|nr:uncharacterized protein LOC111006766 [Momordica charantia]